MQKLLIFPYNGNGLEALSCIGKKYEFLGFIDDTKEKQGTDSFGHKIFDREALKKYPKAKVLAVPGSAVSYSSRDKIIAGLKLEQKRFTTIIHPSAVISPLAKIGNNVLIMAGVVITSNAIIGDHVCILPNSVIHHDSIIGEYSIIGSNVVIASSTKVGALCYIGSGSSIINNIVIGNKTLVGMGTNVTKSLPTNSKAVGNPARLI